MEKKPTKGILHLLIIVSLLLHTSSCTTYEEPFIPQDKPKVEFLLLSENPHLQKIVSQFTSTPQPKGKSSSLFSEIDFEHAVKRDNPEIGITHYSFSFITDDHLTMKKFIISENENYELIGRVFVYEIDTDWLAEVGEFSGWHQYNGYFKILNMDGEVIAENTILEGKSVDNEPENGRSSGTTCTTTTWQICTSVGGQIIGCYYETETNCVSIGGTGGGFPNWDDNDPYGGNGGMGMETISLQDIRENGGEGTLSVADKWELDVCIKDAFKNNSCLLDVWNKLKASNAGYEVLAGFLKSNPESALCLDVKDLGSTVNGNTVTTGTLSNASITINLNSQKLNRSKLSVARTILHEMIHAELKRMVIEAGYYNHLEQFAANYQGDDPFMMIWEYYNTYGNYVSGVNPGWQHEYMADYYIEFIASGLAELHPLLSSQAFINHGNDTSDVLGDPFSWNDMFYYMAWVGLQETEQFQTDIVNKGKQEIYGEYLRIADQESLTNKCN